MDPKKDYFTFNKKKKNRCGKEKMYGRKGIGPAVQVSHQL